MRKPVIAGVVVALLAVPAASWGDAKPNAKSPAQACRALRAANEAAFKAQYRNFGQCVSQHAPRRTRTPEAIVGQENAAQSCLDQRRADAPAFAAKFGPGRAGFNRCVAGQVRSRPLPPQRRSGHT